MPTSDPYQDYLDRLSEVGAGHKRLTEDEFGALDSEYERLILRMDPDDIQLDEWKRAEELRFLLILADDEEDE